MGGGNFLNRSAFARAVGLSPRGRGKPLYQGAQERILRSIPAWAGETWILFALPPAPWVYPRVGGGNLDFVRVTACAVGLSPRGRGKLQNELAKGQNLGSIPAWAGETSPVPSVSQSETVYPRVGGGNRVICVELVICRGLSPRGRGKLLVHALGYGCDGSIPAWAGETPSNLDVAIVTEVYPRVGGGN